MLNSAAGDDVFQSGFIMICSSSVINARGSRCDEKGRKEACLDPINWANLISRLQPIHPQPAAQRQEDAHCAS